MYFLKQISSNSLEQESKKVLSFVKFDGIILFSSFAFLN